MRVITFDFDDTLSDSEMTVLLDRKNDMADEMADITEQAMNDEMSYAESLRSRARLLKGFEEEFTEEAYDEIELHPDATDLVQHLRDYDHHVAIFTGGFEHGVERALEKEGVKVDDIASSRLPMKGGRFTGDVEGSLIKGTKDTALRTHATELDVPMGRTVAVGDGVNDLPVLEVAGLSVGFIPEDTVRPACDAVVASMDRLGELFKSHGVLDADE